MRSYYERNRARLDAQSLEWGNKQHLKVITLLGGKCVGCEINDIEVLAVDHTHNNGASERRQFKNQRSMFAKILREQDKINYQLLCHNCNWKKRLRMKLNAKRFREAA